MNFDILVANTKRWLSKKHINPGDEWITACTEFVLDEKELANRINSLSATQITGVYNEVFQQWMHADLKEIRCSSLPPNITLQQEQDASQRLSLGAGKFAVQLEWVLDVATPAFSQLMKVTGSESKNEEVTAFPEENRFKAAWEPKKKRMLKFEVNDGSRSCYCMEWKPFKKMNDKLPPGTKMYIVGPVRIVRGGTLFLSDENVEILGGDVDAMVSGHPLVTLLARRLNLRPAELEKRFPKWDQQPAVSASAVQARSDNEPEERDQDNQPLIDISNRNGNLRNQGQNQDSGSFANVGSVTIGTGSSGPVGRGGTGRHSAGDQTLVKREIKTEIKTEPRHGVLSDNQKSKLSSNKAVVAPPQRAGKQQTLSPFLRADPVAKQSGPSSRDQQQQQSKPSKLEPPSTPTQQRAVLTDLFGQTQSGNSSVSEDQGGQQDSDFDDFDDDDIFNQLDAVNAEIDNGDKRTSPQIETTLNFHPSTQQVVSTSVKLQNFSGELDISRTGEIKVSSSSPLKSPKDDLSAAVKASRGMAIVTAAKSKSRTAIDSAKQSSSAILISSDDGDSPDPTCPWTSNKPPRAYQHDPFRQDDDKFHLSQLHGSPPAEKRKLDEGKENPEEHFNIKRPKLTGKQVATVRPKIKTETLSLPQDGQVQTCPIDAPLTQHADLHFDAFEEHDNILSDSKFISTVAKSRPPFQYLDDFETWACKDKDDHFWTKCFIITFIGKFRNLEEGYHIDVKLSDGMSTLNVRITDVVCEKFLGFSSKNLLLWKKNKQEYQEQWIKSSKRLLEFNKMLMHVNCMFRLEKFPESNEHLAAQVTEMRDFSQEDLIRLQHSLSF